MKFQKMAKTITSVVAVALVANLMSCSKKAEKTEPFIKIGKKTYSHAEFKSFSTMQYNHPDLAREGFFPSKRYASTLFIETELLYDEAKQYESQVVGSKEWAWKETFNLGQYFQRKAIKNNMGATEEELRKYFKNNKGVFLFDAEGTDTSFGGFYSDVVEKLFLENYPPTEEFKSTLPGADDLFITKKWYETQQNRRIQFFRDTYYTEQFNQPYPQDIEGILGEGKLITPEDLKIISQWLPATTRTRMEEDPATKREIVGYMAGWKLFAIQAEKKNMQKDESFKRSSKFFHKYEVVRYYLNRTLSEKLGADMNSIDKENLLFAYNDLKGKIQDEIDSTLLNKLAADVIKKKTDAALLEYIATKRKEAGVTFLHPDYKDEISKSSERVFFEADSLSGVGNRDMAKKLYRDLIKYYPFTKEGVEAHRAMAMLFSDEGSYKNAIRSYRDYLLLSEPSDDWCKVYFMIGYTYGENLNKLDLAAANYRWVLKNRPDCDLIDDAEFMYLHLGEPMADVAELQAENARQGRDNLN